MSVRYGVFIRFVLAAVLLAIVLYLITVTLGYNFQSKGQQVARDALEHEIRSSVSLGMSIQDVKNELQALGVSDQEIFQPTSADEYAMYVPLGEYDTSILDSIEYTLSVDIPMVETGKDKKIVLVLYFNERRELIRID